MLCRAVCKYGKSNLDQKNPLPCWDLNPRPQWYKPNVLPTELSRLDRDMRCKVEEKENMTEVKERRKERKKKITKRKINPKRKNEEKKERKDKKDEK